VNWKLLLSFGIATTLALSACGSSARGPYSPDAQQQRDEAKANKLYHDVLLILDSDPEAAEKQLREVLGWDLYHGAAHNNLGVLLLKKGKLYDSAEEFEWARKLMPGHPEPRVNLAIALERGGKSVQAVEAAETALEIAPGNLPAMQLVAYIRIRDGAQTAVTKEQLRTIISRTESPEWRDWARRRLASFRDE
jgi:Flp pilus assembly protein TadD